MGEGGLILRRRALLLILATCFCFAGISEASPYIVVDEPDLRGAVVLFTDLFQRGRIECLLGKEQSLYLVDGEEHQELISGIPGQITALAAGDLTGDLRQNLVVGTAGAGGLYFYSLRSGEWKREAEPIYLWDSIRYLEICDLNGDGWGDVVALTEGGEITIFISWEGRLYPFWKSPPHEVATNVQVLDINQDGQLDVIYTYASGYVGILTWDVQEFVTLWENYPWGSIDSLVVLPLADAPEWLVITSQKMLYGWKWKDGEVVNSRHFYASALGEYLFYIPGVGLLSSSPKTGISLFELHTSEVAQLWCVPGVFGCEVFYVAGEFILRDCGFNYYRLAPDSGEWSIFLNGKDITERVSFYEEDDGQLYFNLKEIGPELGFSVFLLGDWYFMQDQQHLRINPRSERIECNGLWIPFGGTIVEKDGMPYAGPEIFPLFGWVFKLDPARREARLGKSWGWWMH